VSQRRPFICRLFGYVVLTTPNLMFFNITIIHNVAKTLTILIIHLFRTAYSHVGMQHTKFPAVCRFTKKQVLTRMYRQCTTNDAYLRASVARWSSTFTEPVEPSVDSNNHGRRASGKIQIFYRVSQSHTHCHKVTPLYVGKVATNIVIISKVWLGYVPNECTT